MWNYCMSKKWPILPLWIFWIWSVLNEKSKSFDRFYKNHTFLVEIHSVIKVIIAVNRTVKNCHECSRKWCTLWCRQKLERSRTNEMKNYEHFLFTAWPIIIIITIALLRRKNHLFASLVASLINCYFQKLHKNEGGAGLSLKIPPL